MAKDWDKETTHAKKKAFERYIELLKAIQKYYVIAVPLTNYCEEELREKDARLLAYAWEYAPLDMNAMNESLRRIRKTVQGIGGHQAIESHCKKFGWIKTSYNAIQPYTREEVEKEIEAEIPNAKKATPPKSEFQYLLTGLQVGIYLRNRMKELSQQIWFAFEPLARSLSKDIQISRDDFFQLTPLEALASLGQGQSTVPSLKIRRRHKGFVVGVIGNKQVLLSGSIANELHASYNKFDGSGISEIRGTPACGGRVRGTAKVILSHKDFHLLKDGDILVTSMTTPDYVTIMKRASAIVTDEGGLSCHAAIVSRELSIPCVVGTKIATKVLKTGDRVEVDAYHGIVRKKRI